MFETIEFLVHVIACLLGAIVVVLALKRFNDWFVAIMDEGNNDDDDEDDTQLE
jgi:hypothetical protein